MKINLPSNPYWDITITVDKEKILKDNIQIDPYLAFGAFYSLYKYFHSLDGPAWYAVSKPITNELRYDHRYFIHGVEYTKEEWEKERHKLLFSNKMSAIINEGE